MNKIALIIKREYLTRVKKKSFIIMTILGPVLFASLMIIPVWLSLQEKIVQLVEVIDDTPHGLFHNKLKPSETIRFDYPPVSLAQAQHGFYDTEYNIILWIPENIMISHRVNLFFKKEPGILVQERVKNNMEDIIYENQLESKGIDLDSVEAAKIKIRIGTQKQAEHGQIENTNTGVNMAVGFGCAILIYMFIFLYGVQVMRGVIEEKTSRIVEVLISSVKPFQLMMGKIIGVAMVGLTQLVLWAMLTLIFAGIGQITMLEGLTTATAPTIVNEQMLAQGANVTKEQSGKSEDIMQLVKMYQSITQLDFVSILLVFLFYFLGGYLLYSALFAAVGSAVDSETDTQQFMLPITIPLVFAFIIAQIVMQNPEGAMSFWFSMLPLTSPIIMLVRLPFGVPSWELWLSMSLLVFGFFFTVWLAAKIYRIGILMYGKKPSWKELGKWIFYK